MKDAEKIIEMRKLFAQLPTHIQIQEVKRMERIAYGREGIAVSPVKEPDREKIFNSIGDAVRYLRNNGASNAHRSGVHKCLNGERRSAYGYKFRRV